MFAKCLVLLSGQIFSPEHLVTNKKHRAPHHVLLVPLISPNNFCVLFPSNVSFPPNGIQNRNNYVTTILIRCMTKNRACSSELRAERPSSHVQEIPWFYTTLMNVWTLSWTSSIQPTVTQDGSALCALLSDAVTHSGYTAIEDRITNVEWDKIRHKVAMA